MINRMVFSIFSHFEMAICWALAATVHFGGFTDALHKTPGIPLKHRTRLRPQQLGLGDNWCLDVKHGRYFWWVFHMGLSVKKWDINGNTLWIFMGHLTNFDSTWHQIMWKLNEHEVLNHWILRYSTLFRSNPVFLGHLRSTSYLVNHEWDDESWCIWHMVLYDLGLSHTKQTLVGRLGRGM